MNPLNLRNLNYTSYSMSMVQEEENNINKKIMDSFVGVLNSRPTRIAVVIIMLALPLYMLGISGLWSVYTAVTNALRIPIVQSVWGIPRVTGFSLSIISKLAAVVLQVTYYITVLQYVFPAIP